MTTRQLYAALLGAALLSACQRESVEELRADALRYQQRGDASAALIQLKNALALRSNDAETRYQMATAYNDTGEVLAAEKEIRKAIAYGYPQDKAMPVLGLSLLLQGQFEKLLDETGSAALQNDPAILCLRGDALLGLGKTEQARQQYDAALERKPGITAALIGYGKLAYLAQDMDGAREWARKALAGAPDDTDALMFEGDLLRAQREPQQALARYDRVLALRPAHRSAHIEKAYQLIALGRHAEAQKEIAAAQRNTPGSLLVAYAQAMLDYSLGRYGAAQESLQLVLATFPEHMPSVLLAGAVSYHLGYLHQAEQHLRNYLGRYPANDHARQLLASVLLQRGQSPDALTVLAPALKDDNAQTLALAGESYMQVRDFRKAGELFTRATTLDPEHARLRTSLALSKLGAGEQDAAIGELQRAMRLDAKLLQPGMALVQTELSLRRPERALAAVAELEKNLPDNATVQDLKGQSWLASGDTAQARAAFARALVLQPSYFPAASRLMRMELAAGKPELARGHIERFLAANKSHLDAMTAMAELASSDGKQADAVRWLEQASAAHPQSVPAHVRLITQYLLAQQADKALTLARKLQVEHPANPDLLDLLGKSQLANDDRVGALDSYKRLVLALPLSAQAQMQLAALLILMDRPSLAEDHLKNALALQADFPAAQVAMAELQVRQRKFELALMTASRLQRNHPKASAGFQLEGDILLSQGKAATALPAYDKAMALAPSPELVVKSVHALRQAGQPEAARKRMAEWLHVHPRDLRVRLFAAETTLADGAFAAAARQLEAVVRDHPRNVVALNNLAWAYQQAGDQRALGVAERALEIAPDNPSVLDTLGWLLVESGEHQRGQALLTKASQLAPAARDIRYHLAASLARTGKPELARQHLQHALQGDDRFPQAAQARALARQLE